MTSAARVRAVFNHDVSQGAPVTAYYHFGQQYLQGEIHAALEVAFYTRFKPDILKIMNDYAFPCPEGLDLLRSRDDIAALGDFLRDRLPFPEQLSALRWVREQLGDDVIIWDTVFNPWFTIRRNLLGLNIDQAMQDHPAALHALLDHITDAIIMHIRHSLASGANGILYSVPASVNFLSHAQYKTFIEPYDLKLIKAVKSLTSMFVVHIHGAGEIYYRDILAHYPHNGLSWADQTTNLSLVEARSLTDTVLMGGIDESHEFNYRPYTQLEQEITTALASMAGTPFILSPGCVLPPQCPTERLAFMFDTARRLQHLPAPSLPPRSHVVTGDTCLPLPSSLR